MEGLRRGSRSRSQVALYDPKNFTNDRLLRIALKRSELEFKASPVANKNNSASSHHLQCIDTLENIPTVQPSTDDFNDPIALWSSLNEQGLKYGAVKLRPPEGWKPPFCLNLSTLRFPIRKQRLHRLASGGAFTFPKKLWSVDEFCQFGNTFKTSKPWVTSDLLPKTKIYPDTNDGDLKSVGDYEREYWRLVETQVHPVEVIYAADIEVSKTGSGFPNPDDYLEQQQLQHNNDNLQTSSKTDETSNNNNNNDSMYYAFHPWNLLNLPKAKGSLLRHLDRTIPGVTSPWLYFGMLFSSFCWHTEDDYLGASNYQHFGDEKIWYVIPPAKAPQMQRFMKDYLGHRKTAHVLHSLMVQISPNLLAKNGIPVYRAVQHENEYILLWPRTYHCGFNLGFNCNEACNIAPPIWLEWGYLSTHSYRFMRSPCIPFEQLVWLNVAEYLDIESAECLVSLIAALSRMLEEEYNFKQKIKCLQLPLILMENVVALSHTFIPSQKDLSVSTLKYLQSSLNYFHTVSHSSVNINSNSTKGLCKHIDAVVRLPVPICFQCQTSCFQGFLCCADQTHTTYCLSCASTLIEKGSFCENPDCASRVLLYRFPLKLQLYMIELLQNQAKILLEQQQQHHHRETCSRLQKILKQLPSVLTIETFEKQQAQCISLETIGPFVWKSDSLSSKSIMPSWYSSRHNQECLKDLLLMDFKNNKFIEGVKSLDFYCRLATREMLFALQHEIEEENNVDDYNEHDNKNMINNHVLKDNDFKDKNDGVNNQDKLLLALNKNNNNIKNQEEHHELDPFNNSDFKFTLKNNFKRRRLSSSKSDSN